MMYRRFFLFLFVGLIVVAGCRAQDATPLVVMNLAAHPDDEDGATLAYYRHIKNAVAYSVIYTRGEGGQNEIGPELYEALGALRTEETERAARILGTQVHFLNFKDFGYSKFGKEAFAEWGGENFVTARIVYLVRKLKPNVMFTNHDTVTVGRGRQHGQHQAVGISVYNAFHLAADPSYHPEQLTKAGVDLWQPQRLFLRRWRGSQGDHQLEIHIGEQDPISGQTAGEIALNALSQHASQGMDYFVKQGRISPRTHNNYVRIRSATDAPLDSTDLAGNLPLNTKAQPDLTYLIDSGRMPALSEGAITVEKPIVVPGETLTIRWDPSQLPDAAVLPTSEEPAPPPKQLIWHFEAPDGSTIRMNPDGASAELTLAPTAIPTLPKAEHQYDRFLNGPKLRYQLLRSDTDETVAAGYLPVEIAPPVMLEPMAGTVRLTSAKRMIPVKGQVFAPWITGVQLALRVINPEGTIVMERNTPALPLDDAGAFQFTFDVALPEGAPAGDYTLTILAQPFNEEKSYNEVVLEQPARVFHAKVVPNLKVGIIKSYDNTLSQALTELGVDYTLLDSVALAEGVFPHLHTIIVDIRAYLVRQDLRLYNANLLDWVKQGGHLVVNYQKVFEWNARYPDPFNRDKKNPGNFAPYPLELGRHRVTYEDAPVTPLVPDHVLLHQPNEIVEADWGGWVQERGLYFPETWDDQYTELFSMHDPGEAPLTGSTLLASYGKGTYLYTALGWYRQLKVFHSGAYRIFANLIGLPHIDGRHTASSN